MGLRPYKYASALFVSALIVFVGIANAQDMDSQTGTTSKKPNIVFIMGDDIGMWNIGA